MIKNALLTSPGTSEKVLKILETYTGSIPTSGFLAGQSVCSALRELSGFTKGVVYNDADIFQLADPLATQVASKPSSSWIAEQTHMSGVAFTAAEMQGYDPTPRLTSLQTAYALRSVHNENFLQRIYVEVFGLNKLMEEATPDHISNWLTRIGAMNFVEVNSLENQLKLQSSLFGLNILAGFDINAVRVGICLDTLQLIYMPDFLGYSTSNQLEVSCSNTPFQSMVRALKKQEEGVGYLDIDSLIMQTKLMLFDYQATPLYSSTPSDAWTKEDAEREVRAAWEDRQYRTAFTQTRSNIMSSWVNSQTQTDGWKDVLARLACKLPNSPFKSAQLKSQAFRAVFLNRSPALTGDQSVSLIMGVPTLKKVEHYPAILKEFELVAHATLPVFSPYPRISAPELDKFVQFTAHSLLHAYGYQQWAIYGLLAKKMSGKLKKSLGASLDNLVRHVNHTANFIPKICAPVIDDLVRDEHALKRILPAYQSSKPLNAVVKWSTDHPELANASLLKVDEACYVMSQYQIAQAAAEFANVYSVARDMDTSEWKKLAKKPSEEIQAILSNKLAEECERIRHTNVLKTLKFDLHVPEPYGDWYSVKEITLQSELDSESDLMHHCVRGYGQLVSSKSSYIVSIRHHSNVAKLSGTLEVGIRAVPSRKPGCEGTVSFEVNDIQLRSLSNTTCCKDVKIISENLLNQINDILTSASIADRVAYLGKHEEWSQYQELLKSTPEAQFTVDQPFLLSNWYSLMKAQVSKTSSSEASKLLDIDDFAF